MNFFITRQPVFYKTESIFGYKLIYSPLSNEPDDEDIENSNLLDSIMSIGKQTLSSGKKIFLDFSSSLLEKDFLYRKDTFVHITKDIPGDSLSVCRELKKAGYYIALNSDCLEIQENIINHCDLVVVDFRNKNAEYFCGELIKLFSPKIFADNISTRRSFDKAVICGCTYFNGEYFKMPVSEGKKPLSGNRFVYIELLKEANSPDPDFQKIEFLIKKDVTITYTLLKYINSAAFYFVNDITSVKQALALLGQKGTVKWLSWIVLSVMSQKKPGEIITLSLIRATFSEEIAEKIGYINSFNFFIMGLFSFLDIMLDCPMKEALKEIPVSSEIKDALLGIDNDYKLIHDLVLAYEQGNFQKVLEITNSFNIEAREIILAYIKALSSVTENLLTA